MATWRNAASLILTARHGQKHKCLISPYNYLLLCLKRHQDSSLNPSSYVFPGGNIDPADSNLKWRELFTAFGFDDDHLASLVPKVAVRPEIFQSRPNELWKEISLRITAIRETFEECGALVCRQRDDRPFSPWGRPFSVLKKELGAWQKKIHNDASEFLTFCKTFECYPDLWALHEWNNWLTPTYAPKRYNTVFYFACLESIPSTESETTEIEDLKWETPEYFWSSTDIVLPPPQQVEITKLAKFNNIDHLLGYAVKRSKAGVQSLYLPVRINLKDGIVHVLPGDTMYPTELDPSARLVIDKSDIGMDEFREMTPVKHRTESLDNRMTIFHLDDDAAESRTAPENLQIKNEP